MKRSILVVEVIVFIFLLTSFSYAGIANFQGIGDLPTGQFLSRAYGVSNDGTTVVGSGRLRTISDSYNQAQQAFRWESSTGMEPLGAHPTGDADSTEAFAASLDGSVVVGTMGTSGPSEACRWTAESGMLRMGFLDGDDRSSFEDVSADGSVAIGWSASSKRAEAVLWTESDGMVGLGHLISSPRAHSFAFGVSNDGSVVVGYSAAQSNWNAFRWTESRGMVSLGGPESASNPASYAYGISGDGTTIVGSYSLGDDIREAFVWTESEGMVGLGDLAGGRHYSRAEGVSGDGSIVVGWGLGDSNYYEAFIWDEMNDIRSLKDVLVNDYGLELDNWTLYNATGISDDGLTIVGYGRNPSGAVEAWTATIPEPATIVLLGLGTLAFRKRRA